MTMKAPQGFNAQRGTTMFAQVASRDTKGYMLRMGDNLVRAQSGSPLQVGQQVQMQVQNSDGGQLTMKMLPAGQTQTHSAGDLANSLAALKMPVNESTMELAQALVEHKLPLTKENMELMQRATQTPGDGSKQAPLPQRVASAAFLQQNGLPATPQNVATLSNFLSNNPQMGQQMMAMNSELRKLVDRGGDAKGFEDVRELLVELADKESGGKLGSKTKNEPRVPPKKFYDQARQAGIEFGTGPFPGEDNDPWETLAQYRELREKTGDLLGEEMAERLDGMLNEAEDNLAAQRLLNSGRMGELGCLYFQVPLRLDRREDAEVWLYYRRRGGPLDELGDEFRAEVLLHTNHLGDLLFAVEVSDIDVMIFIEVEEAAGLTYVENSAPFLQDRLSRAGWRVKPIKVGPRRTVTGHPQLVPQPLDEIPSYDVQA